MISVKIFLFKVGIEKIDYENISNIIQKSLDNTQIVAPYNAFHEVGIICQLVKLKKNLFVMKY